MKFTFKPDLNYFRKTIIQHKISTYVAERFIEADECIWWVVDPAQAGFFVCFRIIHELESHYGRGFFSYEKNEFYIDVFE